MSGTQSVAERSVPVPSRARNFGVTFIVTAVTSALSFVSGLLAARILHPVGRGELAAIQLLPAALGTFAMLGLWESVVYFGCRDRARGGTVLVTATAFSLCVAPVFIVVGLLLIPKVLAAQTPHVIHYAELYLALIVLYSILFMPQHAARTLGELTTWNALRLLPSVTWVGVLVIAYFRRCPDPALVAIGYLVSLCLLIPVNWGVLFWRLRAHGSSWNLDMKLLNPMLRYGVPSAMGSVPQVLNLRLDQMLMSALLPPRQLGLYVVAVAWSSIVSQLMSAVAQPLFPMIASQTDERTQVRLLGQVTRVTLLLAMAMAILIAAATPVILPALFGGDYRGACAPAVILVFAAVFSGINYVLEEGVRGLGDTPAVFWAESCGLVVTAVVLATSLRPLGILGAALASIAGYATTTFFLVIRVCNRSSADWHTVVVPNSSDVLIFKQWTRKLAGLAERS